MKSVLCDLDGVVYRGKRLIEGVSEFWEKCRHAERPVLFLTNGATKTPEQYAERLTSMGLRGVTPEHFFSSALATAEFIKTQKGPRTAYIVGEYGLIKALEDVGVTFTEDKPHYVVVGHTNDFHFSMLKKASNFIRNGAAFVGTNPDLVDPVEEGVEPGCGSLIAAVSAASGVVPYIVGKPNPFMLRKAMERLGSTPDNTIMIGDRMDTDIRGAHDIGVTSYLALSGITREEDLKQYAYRPDHIVAHVGHIDFKIC